MRDERERAEQLRADQEARARAEEARRQEVASLGEWARTVLADPDTVVLDTETTGTDDDSCVVEIAVQTVHGEVLLNSLVNPGCSIPPEATAIHHITDEMVSGAPAFGELLDDLAQALDGRRCLIYNRRFDVGRLQFELTRYYRAAGHEDPTAAAATWLDSKTFADVMIPYSDWVGDWDEYWGNYAWQQLRGDHRALGDCRAVVKVLRRMAKGRGFAFSEGAGSGTGG